jgi:hypothetical protein
LSRRRIKNESWQRTKKQLHWKLSVKRKKKQRGSLKRNKIN